MIEKTCENCIFSGVYGGNLVCWLYSEDEILYLDEQSKPCSDYDEGAKMSRNGNYDYDNMSYKLEEFLRDHAVSELLMLVTDAVKEKETEDAEIH